jgi:hypothetical protein
MQICWYIPVIAAIQKAEIRRISVPSQSGKKVRRHYFTKQAVHTVIPATWEPLIRGIKVQGQPYAKMQDPNQRIAKGLGCSSSDRAPTSQAQGPEFKPQYHQINNNNKKQEYFHFKMLH